MIKEVRSFNFVYSHTRVSEVSTSGSKKGFTLCSKMRNLLQFSNLITPFSIENAVHAWKIRKTRTQISIRLDSNLFATSR